MKLTSKANEIHAQISLPGTKLCDLRKIALRIKKDHELALELFGSGEYLSRQLAILIMDKKRLNEKIVDEL